MRRKNCMTTPKKAAKSTAADRFELDDDPMAWPKCSICGCVVFLPAVNQRCPCSYLIYNGRSSLRWSRAPEEVSLF